MAPESSCGPRPSEEALASSSQGATGTPPNSEPHRDWLLWQLADSAFPCGGFAHSAGLEAAVQQGEIRDAEQLRAFLEASLRQCGHASLPFMTASYDDPDQLPALDRLCEAYTSNHVANRASRLQGQALLASAQRIFATAGWQRFRPIHGTPLPSGHLAPVFGVVLRELGFARSEAGRLFLFFHLRGLVSAAVRLGLVGPLRGQTVQHELANRAETILQEGLDLSVEQLGQTAPLLDLWQANQDRLYSRLFQS